jgi:hypothetical protein
MSSSLGLLAAGYPRHPLSFTDRDVWAPTLVIKSNSRFCLLHVSLVSIVKESVLALGLYLLVHSSLQGKDIVSGHCYVIVPASNYKMYMFILQGEIKVNVLSVKLRRNVYWLACIKLLRCYRIRKNCKGWIIMR